MYTIISINREGYQQSKLLLHGKAIGVLRKYRKWPYPTHETFFIHGCPWCHGHGDLLGWGHTTTTAHGRGRCRSDAMVTWRNQNNFCARASRRIVRRNYKRMSRAKIALNLVLAKHHVLAPRAQYVTSAAHFAAVSGVGPKPNVVNWSMRWPGVVELVGIDWGGMWNVAAAALLSNYFPW